MNSNLDEYDTELIAGFEWNVQSSKSQIDMTWWMSWYDLGNGNRIIPHAPFQFKMWSDSSKNMNTTFQISLLKVR